MIRYSNKSVFEQPSRANRVQNRDLIAFNLAFQVRTILVDVGALKRSYSSNQSVASVHILKYFLR